MRIVKTKASAKSIAFLQNLVYNIVMTLNSFMQHQPTVKNGKVTIDQEVFDELMETYIRARVSADVELSRQQYKDGKGIPADEIFAQWKKKYGYKQL